MMGFPLTDVQALAIVLTVLVVTAGAVRMVVSGIQFCHPFSVLLGWIGAMAGGILLMTAGPALLAGVRPIWSLQRLGWFVAQFDLPLASLGAIVALAAAVLEILRPVGRSSAAKERAASIGAAGEDLVVMAMQRAGYPTLNSVMLGGRGWSTEIDHVVQTRGSIVAIETKTLAGRIEGRPADRRWVQRNGGWERWFFNPLRQNATHLDVLRRTIGPLDVPLRGLVVVAGTAAIGDELRGCVVPVSDLVRVLDDEPSPGARDLDRAWATLQQIAARGGDPRAHAAYVRRRWHRV